MRFIGNKTNLLNDIQKVIKENCDGSEKVFCDLFSGLYYYEKSYYRFFKDKDKELLDELANMVECFSDDIDYLKKYPNYYVSDYQLDKKIKEVQRYFEKKLSVRSDN